MWSMMHSIKASQLSVLVRTCIGLSEQRIKSLGNEEQLIIRDNNY